jgi:hypothetical protein
VGEKDDDFTCFTFSHEALTINKVYDMLTLKGNTTSNRTCCSPLLTSTDVYVEPPPLRGSYARVNIVTKAVGDKL